MAKKLNRSYNDLDLDFINHPVTQDVSVKVDDEAVKRSIRNLVFMNRYEKPFHPEINSGIRALLFEPLTPLTSIRLRQQIRDTIINFEPRAELLQLAIQEFPKENAYKVSILFRVKNTMNPVSFNFALERLR